MVKTSYFDQPFSVWSEFLMRHQCQSVPVCVLCRMERTTYTASLLDYSYGGNWVTQMAKMHRIFLLHLQMEQGKG